MSSRNPRSHGDKFIQSHGDRVIQSHGDRVIQSHDEQDVVDFDLIMDRALSRRGFLGAGIGVGAAALVMGSTALTPLKALAADRFGFKAVAAGTEDTIRVPEGYRWHVVSSWGDPLWSKGKAFDEASRGDAASQALAMGDNNDGMHLFHKDGKDVLVVNNEYVNVDIIHGNRASKKAETDDDVQKSKNAVGVTVVEIASKDGKWGVVKDAPLNRRINGDTPMQITGPARGHELLKTAADPKGEVALGTWNNCGQGHTPWGTYLTCEENFDDFFGSTDKGYKPSADMKRYGVGIEDDGYNWIMADERFDISKHPNEPNRFGYIVEIDPFDPKSTPKKRTALGRFKHENAELVVNKDGRVVVYLGDDERGEFLYRFVSKGKYVEGGDNRDLLDDGTLYVAKFDDKLTGKWLALTPETTGMASQAEICIHTRQAASKVGATTMDRPEWVAAHPNRAEVYCALTNNKNRGKKTNAGGDATPVGGPNPREGNNYGQIVRWRPAGGDHTAEAFEWDLFVLAGNPTVHTDSYGGSKNVTADNMFNSPDGLKFDSRGFLWIETDGNYSNKKDFAGMGNNQVLVGDPETGEIRRFMVGPNECEITGIAWSEDKKTVFFGIQHPGEKGNSHFPNGGNSVPRSSIVAVVREDDAVVG